MIDPQQGSYWEHLEREGREAQYREDREWRDRRNPRDVPKVWLPRAGREEDDESH